MIRSAFLSLAVLLAAAPLAAQETAPVPRVKPQAPESPYISRSDERVLRAVFDALDDGQDEEADALRQLLADPLARAVADWAYFRGVDEDRLDPAEVGAFLDTHYGWPSADYLQGRAEGVIADRMSADAVIAFFDQRDPETGEGHLALARAFLAKGNEEAAVTQLRTAWVDYDWARAPEIAFLRDYGRYLTPEDHFAKADRQLFEIKATVTERILGYLTPKRRAEARARIALLRRDRNAEDLFLALSPESRRDSGVLHAATRYYRRGDEEEKAVVFASLAPLSPAALRNPESWYTERAILARWALKTGRFEDAYILSAYSGLERGADFAAAEFMAGWISLRFLDDPDRAKAHFRFLRNGVTSPISLSRGAYWLGRAYAASGDAEMARQQYRVAAAYPFNYYGQLAIHELGADHPPTYFPPTPEPSENDLLVFNARPLVHAMRILAEVDQDWHFDRFARSLDDQIEQEGEVRAYSDLVMGERKPYLAVRAGKIARNNGLEVPGVVYPVIPVPEQASAYAETALILGLSRQESEFNPRAYSSARARGLMQLLTSTAQITARKEGLPYSASRLFDDPDYNLVIGAAHLSHLLEDFRGSYVMTLAAYNAGPNRVDRWIEEYGDPRDPSVDPIDWVELIPFSETRNYVMRVLENTEVYRARLHGAALGSRLHEDLIRGGNRLDSFANDRPAPKLWEASAEAGGALMDLPEVPPLAHRQLAEEDVAQ